MTNGEKLKVIFPNIIKYGNILIDDTGALQRNILFDDTWWNAEYQEPTEEKHSKTCGTCRYFRKNQSKKNIEICKELYGENTMSGHCTYWEDTHEVALPTIEYDYCSHHREVE